MLLSRALARTANTFPSELPAPWLRVLVEEESGRGGGLWMQLWPRMANSQSSGLESDHAFSTPEVLPPYPLSQPVAREMDARKTSQSSSTLVPAARAVSAARLSGQPFRLLFLNGSVFQFSRSTLRGTKDCSLTPVSCLTSAVTLACLKLAIERSGWTRTRSDLSPLPFT